MTFISNETVCIEFTFSNLSLLYLVLPYQSMTFFFDRKDLAEDIAQMHSNESSKREREKEWKLSSTTDEWILCGVIDLGPKGPYWIFSFSLVLFRPRLNPLSFFFKFYSTTPVLSRARNNDDLFFLRSLRYACVFFEKDFHWIWQLLTDYRFSSLDFVVGPWRILII